MCIEYWFVLHFYDMDGQPIPMKGFSHSQAQIDLVEKTVDIHPPKTVISVHFSVVLA